MGNRILIFGYFGCGNLGDETNLRQLIDWIREIEPEVQLAVISANPAQTARDYQVTTVGKFNISGIVGAIRSASFLFNTKNKFTPTEKLLP